METELALGLNVVKICGVVVVVVSACINSVVISSFSSSIVFLGKTVVS